MSEDDELESYLKISLQKTGEAKQEELTRIQLKEIREQIKGAERPLNLSDPIPVNLIKGYYQLRYLKSRDHKIRLLHALNYFRSIQRKLTLDLKDIFTLNRNITT